MKLYWDEYKKGDATMALTAIEIQDVIVSSFTDANDYLTFMQSDDNNATDWQRVNQVEIESEFEYNEAIARIQESFKQAALARMEADIKGYEFDQDDILLPLFHHADRDQIATIAEMNYEQAREEIEANGTLF
jgi:hypothetical protein